jgi:hypothetical protein
MESEKIKSFYYVVSGRFEVIINKDILIMINVQIKRFARSFKRTEYRLKNNILKI